MAMGIAELIPGVSGGTIAFLTGIYMDLVGSIQRFRWSVVRQALSGQIRAAWGALDPRFLLVLGAGMGVSIVLFASAIQWLLEHRPIPTWAFFFGLIVASVAWVGRSALPVTPSRALWATLGLGLGFGLAHLQPLPDSGWGWGTAISGALAICAWILPGISGSFVLLLLGQYGPLMGALSTLDLRFLGTLAAGMAVGILAFSRGLQWLLRFHYRDTLAALSGLMLGSLPRIWPWRLPVAGDPAQLSAAEGWRTAAVSPSNWSTWTGAPAQIGSALVLGGLAVLLVAGLEWFSVRRGAGR
jgi:putative membrane protein